MSTDLADLDSLVGDLPPDHEVVRVSSVDALIATLRARRGLQSVHVLSHGRPGALRIGDDVLDSERAAELAEVRGSFAEGADLRLYGCDVAAGGRGEALLGALASATGADLAASNDPTGGGVGGDWTLEVQRGAIADARFAPGARWSHLLLDVAEPPDQSGIAPGANYVLTAGTNTFTGTITTPSDGQDNFTVTIPAGLTLTAVSKNVAASNPAFNGFVIFNNGEILMNSGPGNFTTGFPYGPGTYQVNVIANFAPGNAWSVVFTVAGAANAAPTALGLSATSIAENNAANATIGTFTSTDPNPSDTFTYSLVAGAGSTDNASFNIVGNALRITAPANFETKSSYAIRVRTTDQGGLFFERTFTITITNVNETPTDIGLAPTTVAENAGANATVGTLTTTDPDAGNTFTYTLVAGTGSTDNASFNVAGSTLRLTASADFETKSSYSVRVRATDQGALFFEKAFVVTVTNVNEAPTDLALSNTSIPENAGANAMVGMFMSTDPDAAQTFTYMLVGGAGSADNAAFNIAGGVLRLTGSADFETQSSYAVRVRTTDQGGLSFERAFTINVTNANEAPTALALSNNQVMEYAPNAAVGNLSSTDPDAGSSFTYTLVGGDVGFFQIVGNQLRVGATGLKRSEATTRMITVRTTDGGGSFFERSFTIVVTPFDVSMCNALTITPAALPAGRLGVAYPSTPLAAGGAAAPVTWTIGGTRPAGITFTGGTFAGTPTEAGSFTPMVTARDDRGCSATASLTLTVTCDVAAGAAQMLCQGGSTTGLMATVPTGGSVTGMWTDGAGGGTFAPNATTPDATYTPPAGFSGMRTLRWQLVGSGCDGTAATVALTVNPAGPGMCCTAPAQCDDGDACTMDACTANACVNTAIGGCGVDAGTMTSDAGVTMSDAGAESDAAVELDGAVADGGAIDDAGGTGLDAGNGGADLGVLRDAGRDASTTADGATASDGSTRADGATTPVAGGSCGCRAAGVPAGAPAWVVVGLALALAARRRRRD